MGHRVPQSVVRVTATDITAPLPPIGTTIRRHHPGDRLTWLYLDHNDRYTRVVGTVTHSNTWTFVCRWDEGKGEARFAHNHEPDLLRPATPADEHDAFTAVTRATVAAELRRLADTHTTWPTDVRTVLRRRAADLTGSSR